MASPSHLRSIFRDLNSSNFNIIVVSALKEITNLLIETADLLRSKKYDIAINKIDEIVSIHKREWKDHVSDKVFDEIKIDLEKHVKSCIILQEQSLLARNKLISRGEIYSSILLFELFNSLNIKSQMLKAPEFLFNSNDSYSINKEFLLDCFAQTNILITQGYAYSDPVNKKLKIMERGGSDLSAAIIGSELEASKVIIWTDVTGVYSSDPRKFKTAKILKEISYKQLIELSKFGAKIMQVDSIKPAIEKNIPVIIKNTFDKNSDGTIIKKSAVSDQISISYSNNYLRYIFHQDEIIKEVKLILALSKQNKSNLELINTNNDLNLFTIDSEFNRAIINKNTEKYAILLITGKINQDLINLENIHFKIIDNINHTNKYFIKGKISEKDIELLHNNIIK